jgi:hypothetical protein
VRIAYTPTDLYVGFRGYDSRVAAIVATARKRDDFGIVENDQFAMAIDSYNDGRNGFWFSTNPLGVRVNAQFFEEGERWLGEWNGIWDCVSRLDDQGWMSLAGTRDRDAVGDDAAHGLTLFKGGERNAFKVGYLDVGRGFNPGMGFVRRPGILRLNGDVRLPWYVQEGRLRRVTPLYAGERVKGADGLVESWSHEVGLEAESRQDDFLAVAGGVRFDRVAKAFPIFRSVLIAEGSYEAAWVRGTLRTKQGRRISGEVTLLGGGLYDGHERTAGGRVSLKASRSLTASASW